MSNPLKVFLCYSPIDETTVYTIYERLKKDGYKPWMEAEDVYGGQNTSLEVSKAIKSSQVVLICISEEGLSRAGVLNKGINQALDKAAKQPEGAISIVSLRLNECELPTRLQDLKPLNLFPGSDGFERGYGRLLRTLAARALEVNAAPGKAAAPGGFSPSEQDRSNNFSGNFTNNGGIMQVGGSNSIGTANANSGGVNLSDGDARDISYNDSRGATINNYYGPSSVSPAYPSQPSPVQPSVPLNITSRILTTDERFKLIDLLAAMPSMQNAATRDAVVSNLRYANAISYSPQTKLHITQIVSTSQNFMGGLAELIKAVRFYDSAATGMNTAQYEAVEKYLRELPQ